MKKWIRVLPILGVAVLAAGIGHQSALAKKSEDSVIADRIFIGDVAVGGMTDDEATAAVEKYVDDLADEKITLTINDVSVEATAADLGLSWQDTESVQNAVAYGKSGNLIARYKAKKDLENEDKVFPMPLVVDQEKTTAYLEEHEGELNRDAVDYGLTRENGEFKIIEGQDGIVVDVAKSVDTIDESFQAGWKADSTIELVAEVSKPKGSEEELQKVKDVLGTFSTKYASSASGRKANIANGSKKIDGTVIYPGDEFSVYQTVAPFNADNGYKLAGAYENGTTVDAYGGGICQVSTTLYNAVLRAELNVTERLNHSMTVHYVPLSADAAISGTDKDLKFTNNLDHPIYIQGTAGGSSITFTIYGKEYRASNRKVEYVSQTLSVRGPSEKVIKDNTMEEGKRVVESNGRTGYTARLWKVVYIDGKETKRTQVNSSSYMSTPSVVRVGTKKKEVPKPTTETGKKTTKAEDKAKADVEQPNGN